MEKKTTHKNATCGLKITILKKAEIRLGCRMWMGMAGMGVLGLEKRICFGKRDRGSNIKNKCTMESIKIK